MDAVNHDHDTCTECCTKNVDQLANSSITQIQRVNQSNFSKQSAAIAIAVGGSTAIAEQKSFQSNNNREDAEAETANKAIIEDNAAAGYPSDCGCKDINQKAIAMIGQNQYVDQENANVQIKAIAESSRPYTKKKEIQYSKEINSNCQAAYAKAANCDTEGDRAENPDAASKKETEEVFLPEVYYEPKPTNVNPVKLRLSIKQSGREFLAETDEDGNMSHDILEMGDALKFNENTASSITIAFVIDGQSYEIITDEKDNVFINGQKMLTI